MQGWNIFIHSVRMVFGNLGPALRISGLLYLIYISVHAYYVLNFADALMELQRNMQAGNIPTELPSGLVSTVTLVLVVGLLTNLWIAVLWHRFVLLGQVPETVIPPLYAGMILTYLGKTILLSLVIVIIIGALDLLLSLALGPMLGSSADMVILLILIGVLFYLLYRLGLIFPAVALGGTMTLKASWEKTAIASGAIVQLSVIAVFFVILILISSNMNPDPTSVINLTYSYVVSWIAMMVGISVLSTLYGIYVEGREL